ncbi:MAG: SMI1/KNR4 family protein [Kofleriaceae bacterium]
MRWNAPELWRGEYGGMADDVTCFAEDIFGGQFCLRAGKVHTFDPETGGIETMAKNIVEWVSAVLAEWRAITGAPIAHDWQVGHGVLAVGRRLVPKTPFVLGGELAISNLVAMDDVKGMRFRATLAVQIRDLPDGTPITLKVVD